MASNKKYWKSVEELNENSSIVETLQQNEFVDAIPTDEFLGDKEALESSSTSSRDCTHGEHFLFTSETERVTLVPHARLVTAPPGVSQHHPPARIVSGGLASPRSPVFFQHQS